MQLPWPGILPSAARSILKTLEEGQSLGRCSCRLAPVTNRAWVTPAIPMEGYQDLPVAAHQLVKDFFLAVLVGVNAFLLSSAFLAFLPYISRLAKRMASLPCTLAVLDITDHPRTSKSSASSVSSASPILRRPNLKVHEVCAVHAQITDNNPLLCIIASAPTCETEVGDKLLTDIIS